MNLLLPEQQIPRLLLVWGWAQRSNSNHTDINVQESLWFELRRWSSGKWLPWATSSLLSTAWTTTMSVTRLKPGKHPVHRKIQRHICQLEVTFKPCLTSSGKGRSQRVLLLLALFGNHSASLHLYKVGEGQVRSLLVTSSWREPVFLCSRDLLFYIMVEFSLKQDWREVPWTPSPPG